jgi:hypothetical protein
MKTEIIEVKVPPPHTQKGVNGRSGTGTIQSDGLAKPAGSSQWHRDAELMDKVPKVMESHVDEGSKHKTHKSLQGKHRGLDSSLEWVWLVHGTKFLLRAGIVRRHLRGDGGRAVRQARSGSCALLSIGAAASEAQRQRKAVCG